MKSFIDLNAALSPHGLMVMGGFTPGPEDGLENEIKTLVLIGPQAQKMWSVFSNSPEFQDAEADPLDRWSKRVIGGVARELEAEAVYPSDGPPYPPFISWALNSERIFSSPVGLLVHETAGLMVSFRGALKLPWKMRMPPGTSSPCLSCPGEPHRPCEMACPVNAFQGGSYDVQRCKSYVNSVDGGECREAGCQVRRACPISQLFDRSPEQSAFHMRAFL